MTEPAQTYRWESHAEARVKFEVPNDWATQEGEKSKTVTSPDGVTIEFRYFSLGAVEALHDEKLLTKELEGMAKDIKITNGPSKFSRHGLAGFGAGGTGQRDGGAILWLLQAVGDRRGHGMIACGFAAQASWVAALPNIQHIIGSMQPMDGPPAP